MFHKRMTALYAGVALSALAFAVRAADDGVGGGGGFSLADLAELDVSDIEEVRASTLPQGAYVFEVKDIAVEEGVDKDNLSRATVTINIKVAEVMMLVDPKLRDTQDALVGRQHTERFYLPFEKGQEELGTAIGRVRAFATDIGLDSSGKWPDLIERFRGHVFKGRVTHQRNPNDASSPYTRLKVDARENSAAA